MNPLYQAVARLQKRLADAGVPSAVIGGIAVSVWARPRATLDIDFKVQLTRGSAQKLLDILGQDYTPLQSDPIKAVQQYGILFVREESGIKIDLQVADVTFDELAIRRAHSVELEAGLTARVCSAEDLIIYKMISTRLQDQVDVENVVRRQGNQLDDAYVLRWLRSFEQALDDSTLVSTYRVLRSRHSR